MSVYIFKVRVVRDPFMIGNPKRQADSVSPVMSRSRNGNDSFTLVELLAVMLVIIVLAGITIGVASYTQKKIQTQIARTQITLLGAALESYKADWGSYPATDPPRISTSYLAESTNNAYLYRALFAQGKKYLTGFPASQIRTNQATGLTNIVDVFGIPFNYYNSPATVLSNMNNVYGVNSNCGYTVGGQVNKTSYDLFSYGPNHLTYVPGAFAVDVNRPWAPSGWAWAGSALDDITNWH